MQEPSGWLREMYDHRGRTGIYRPEDLQRVLGDPRKAVGLPVLNELAAASGSNRKG